MRSEHWAAMAALLIIVLILWYNFEKRISDLELELLELDAAIWYEPDRDEFMEFRRRLFQLELAVKK